MSPVKLFLTLCLLVPVVNAATVAERSLKICVATDAAPEITAAAQQILAAADKHPLLALLSGAKPPTTLTDSRALANGAPEARAFDHLVLIGLADDPLISAAWQREARVEKDSWYVFGFGHLAGDLGYLESDRNPFLHSRAIASAPYETEVVTLTGASARGVALAVNAFLRQGLVNGVVAAPGWSRSQASLLARDPLPPDFAAPEIAPAQLGDMRRIGLTQAGEDEYRGVLADTGVKPREIWRVKYHQPGAWDGAGAQHAVAAYAAGLHRRAYGSTLWCARFSAPAEAVAAAAKIAEAARIPRSGPIWKGPQPPYGWGNDASPGPLSLRQRGEWVLLSTLPETNSDLLDRK